MDRAEVLEVRALRRDLGLVRVVLGLAIVRERLLEVVYCLRLKRLHRVVRLGLDSVAAELRGTRRTRKSR